MHKPEIVSGVEFSPEPTELLQLHSIVHKPWDAENLEAVVAKIGLRARAIAAPGSAGAGKALMPRLPTPVV